MIAPRDLRKAMGCFATGVGIVATTTRSGEPAGLTVNSLTSVSLDPPLILISLDLGSASLGTIRDAGCFSVSILRADQSDLALRFARDDRGSRFDGLRTEVGVTGAPRLSEAVAWLDCTVWKEVEAGDHVLLLGEVLSAGLSRDSHLDPLVFFQGRYGTHS